MTSLPSGRWQWGDLPDEAQAAVRARLGPIRAIASAPAGLTVAVAARLVCDAEEVFLSALPVRSPAVGHFRTEVAVARFLPQELVPRLLWHDQAGGWLLSLTEYVHGARHPDLTPGSLDLAKVRATLGTLVDRMSPNPWPDAPAVTDRLHTMADTLGGRVPEGYEDIAQRVETLKGMSIEGDTLVHGDLHAGNLLATDRGMKVIDWSLAARGPGWFDAASIATRCIAAGHSPSQAAEALAAVPGWSEAPSDQVAAIAAVRALFNAHLAVHGPTRLRPQRAKSAAANAAWVRHTDLRGRQDSGVVRPGHLAPRGGTGGR